MMSAAYHAPRHDPQLIQNVGLLLDRMGRPDLARQVTKLAGLDREDHAALARGGYAARPGPAGYSIEIDSNDNLITVEVTTDHRIAAIHVRKRMD